jgi:hypothetical protein
MYGFLTAGEPRPEAVAHILADSFGVPLRAVDVSPQDEREDRAWEATVTCDYEFLCGDLGCHPSVYGAQEVPAQPA